MEKLTPEQREEIARAIQERWAKAKKQKSRK